MTTQTTARPTLATHQAIAPAYVQHFSDATINWLIDGAVWRGDIPADLFTALYTPDSMRDFYKKFRGDRDIKHRILLAWYEATAREQSITVDQAAEIVNFELCFYSTAWALVPRAEEATEAAEVEPELTEEEVKAARKILNMIKKDEKENGEAAINRHILGYILAGHNLADKGFCNTAGIDTRTMQARGRAIVAAAKTPKNTTVQQHLRKILKIKTVSRGGWAKTR